MERRRAQVPAAVAAGRPLRVAMLAPPWLPVPPPGYGGIEAVVASLTRGLAELGHEITLLAAPGSASPHADVVPVLSQPYPRDIGRARHEADHVATAISLIEHRRRSGRPFDVVHDHGDGTLVAFADRLDLPVVHTVHGAFDAPAEAFYAHHARRAAFIALSHAQLDAAPPELDVLDVIPNPIELDRWPLRRQKEEMLLWVGRFSPDKGAHLAIEVAHRAGRPLVLAGVVQPGQEPYFEALIRPHLDERTVHFVGEIGGQRKQEFFARASALLMPITWPEPFGMVMVEAMASGTPVLAFRAGSASEVVEHGVSGFLSEDLEEMAATVERLGELDPRRIRAGVRRRFGLGSVARAYETAYRQAIAGYERLKDDVPPAHRGSWSTASAS